MPKQRQFGVSTHLFHNQRLGREHLLEVAAHGFEAVELFATRTHFDYHNSAAVADLQQWLAEAGLELHGIHAPVSEGYFGGRPTGVLNIASADPAQRQRAMTETELALYVARRIPTKMFVAHLGVPRSHPPAPGENSRAAARRSIEELQRAALPLGVQVALEVLPNDLSHPRSLVHFVEEDVDEPGVGICLDCGHAHMTNEGLVDAIETVSGHLVTTHVHDNRGRLDEHLVPFEGTIDWSAAITAMKKVGYDGPMMLEVAQHGPPRETLRSARKARARLEALLSD